MSRTADPSVNKKRVESDSDEGKSPDGGARRETSDRADIFEEHPYVIRRRDKPQRNKMFYYSGIGFFVLGMVQFVFFNPLTASGFSMWDRYAYMRGIPWYVCTVLPYAMIVGDLLIIAAGILGILLSRRKGSAWFYKMSGTMAAILSAGLLVTRIIHEHVIFKSVGLDSYAEVLPEAITHLQEQYSRSLYAVFVFTAIAAMLSFCYIYFSFRFGKVSSFNAGKAMVATAALGSLFSLCGVLFGQDAGIKVPLIAAWAMAAFIVMLVIGAVGLDRRRSPTVRAILGFAQLVIFTFCMLQTIYYAYSATVQGEFFRDGPFFWITALAGVFAISTALSSFYMADAVFLKKQQINKREKNPNVNN